MHISTSFPQGSHIALSFPASMSNVWCVICGSSLSCPFSATQWLQAFTQNCSLQTWPFQKNNTIVHQGGLDSCFSFIFNSSMPSILHVIHGSIERPPPSVSQLFFMQTLQSSLLPVSASTGDLLKKQIRPTYCLWSPDSSSSRLGQTSEASVSPADLHHLAIPWHCPLFSLSTALWTYHPVSVLHKWIHCYHGDSLTVRVTLLFMCTKLPAHLQLCLTLTGTSLMSSRHEGGVSYYHIFFSLQFYYYMKLYILFLLHFY